MLKPVKDPAYAQFFIVLTENQCTKSDASVTQVELTVMLTAQFAESKEQLHVFVTLDDVVIFKVVNEQVRGEDTEATPVGIPKFILLPAAITDPAPSI